MIVICGGGTGGHLKIAQVFKNTLNKKHIQPIFIGSTLGQDRQWFDKENGFEKAYFLNSEQVMKKNALGKIKAIWTLLKTLCTVYKIFKNHKSARVISVGGYSAAPAVLGAILFRKKLFIHEQNAVPGQLNQISKPFAEVFFSSFNATSPVSGYPVYHFVF